MMCDFLKLKLSSVLIANDFIPECELNNTFETFYFTTNGIDAYISYCENKPDIVVTSIDLPSLNGLELVKKIRERDYRTAVILLASHFDTKTLYEAANFSIDGCLELPLSCEKLLTVLSNALKRLPHKHETIKLSKNTYYHYGKSKVERSGMILNLDKKEELLIQMFLDNSSNYVTQNDIIQTLFRYDECDDSFAKFLVGSLRNKLGNDCIHYENNKGWKFNFI